MGIHMTKKDLLEAIKSRDVAIQNFQNENCGFKQEIMKLKQSLTEKEFKISELESQVKRSNELYNDLTETWLSECNKSELLFQKLNGIEMMVEMVKILREEDGS